MSLDLTVPKFVLENLCDLFIGKAFDVPKHDDGAERLRHLPQLGLDVVANFPLRGKLEGRLLAVNQCVF